MKLNHPLKKIKLSFRAIQKVTNWWDYFADYLGLKKGDVIYDIGGKKIKTRAGTIDKSIFTEVALEELYFPKWLKLSDNATVIDVGAHIGIFSVLASAKFKGGNIYSIEPSKENFEMLKEQEKLNNGGIQPFNLALSDKQGRMKLYGGEHSARGSLLREEGMKHETVKTDTLKNFFKKNKIKKCDLMKMDIEGGEYPVLYSTPKEVFDKIDRIFIEIHKIDGENRKELINYLEDKGFKTEYNEEDFVYAFK